MTTKKEELWATFYAPGSFVGETWDSQVKSHDISTIKWPQEAYAVQFWKRTTATIDGESLNGPRVNVGPLWYHPDSHIETIEQVSRRRLPRGNALLYNMKLNGWKRVIWTRWDSWPQPYDPKHMKIAEAAK